MKLAFSPITSLSIMARHMVWQLHRTCSLSAVAQRTKRLRLGPLVMLLNLYHPLRAFEEICMLDQTQWRQTRSWYWPRGRRLNFLVFRCFS